MKSRLSSPKEKTKKKRIRKHQDEIIYNSATREDVKDARLDELESSFLIQNSIGRSSVSTG